MQRYIPKQLQDGYVPDRLVLCHFVVHYLTVALRYRISSIRHRYTVLFFVLSLCGYYSMIASIFGKLVNINDESRATEPFMMVIKHSNF